MRIGTGYDVHGLITGRKLIIGGVTIPFEMGLDGHSDADVLTHAIMDSLLGAMALGDIGAHFPPDDMSYHGIDSMILLDKVAKLIDQSGYKIANIDSVIIAQVPKMAPHIQTMRENIARVLGVDISQIGVKATTTEWLGFEGRSEGIASSAVALLLNK